MNNPRLKEILDEWRWARGLSRDLLDGLPEGHLEQVPIQGAGSWGRQFRHMGRVEENYVVALRLGTVRFSTEGCSYAGAISKRGLIDYLSRMDILLAETVALGLTQVDWFGKLWSGERHLAALVSHEILHHGQLILYARASALRLPDSWKDWGEA